MIKLEKLIPVEKLIKDAKVYSSEELDLSYCGLQIVPKEVFELTDLKVLKLIGNKLESIPKEIGCLTHLTHLYLYQNRINEFSDEVIDSLKYIECIDLADNPIYNDEGKILYILNRIAKWKGYKECINDIEKARKRGSKHLMIHRSVNYFPIEIFTLTDLEYLSFSGIAIEEIPEGIKNLKKLKTLSLGYNKLSSLPKDIIELEELEELNLERNNFHLFPDEVLRLPKLKRFNISANQLNFFNKEIYKMPLLESFYAFDNPFKDIDWRIFNYPFDELKTQFTS